MSESAPTTVLMLADYGGPYRGSFIPALQAVAREVGSRGWRMRCGFTPVARGRPWLAELAAADVAVDFAPGTGRGELGEWLGDRLDQLAGRVVVHTHFTSFDLPAASVAPRHGARVVWHVHSFLPARPLRIASAIVKYGWVGRRVARIVCAGAGPAQAVRRRGAPRGKVVMLLNGVDTERFRPVDPAERVQARAALGLDPQRPLLLHFGWDWPVKGGPLFAETLAELRRGGLQVDGLSVGAGPEATTAARTLRLGEALRASPADEDVRRFYCAADALLATSADEGSPFSILEALSCGLPVIATDIPGHRLGDRAPAALRLAPRDPDALAEVAKAVLERSPERRAAEAREASAWVAEHRDLGAWARSVVGLYDEALAAAASSGNAAATSGGGSRGQ